MSIFKKILLLIIAMNTASYASCVQNQDIPIMRIFMSIYQDLEEYRSWTASKLRELDFRDQQGNVDEEARNHLIETIENDIFSVTESESKYINELSTASKYLGMCKDRINDYFISESLYSSFDFIFKKLLVHEDYETALSIWLEDINEIINACGACFENIREIFRVDEKSHLLPHNYSDISLRIYLQSGEQFFLSLTKEERDVLSCVEDNKDNLYCGLLLSNILTKFESLKNAFVTRTDKAPTPFNTKSCHENRINIMKFALKICDSFCEFNGHENTILSLRNMNSAPSSKKDFLSQKRQMSMLKEAKFNFENFELRVQNEVISYLTQTYNGHLEIPEDLFRTSQVTEENKTSKAKKRKISNNKKFRKPNRNKRKKIKKSAPIDSTIEVQKFDVVTEDDSILNDISNETTTSTNVSQTTSSTTLNEDQPTIENNRQTDSDDDANDHENRCSEFDFTQWYEENVIPFAMKADSKKIETVLTTEDQKAEKEITQFALSEKAKKFYFSTTGRQKEPVKKRHFVAFLTSIGGVLDESGGDGSAVKYWLPNFSDSRDKTRFLKFTVHLPHSGSEHFPWKTLKNFILPALVRCDLKPYRFAL